ncbi:MAG: beta-N-acetylhexosaminidase [Bacteroidaceae bacterium]|nr:beta-N-acetylhexosaminidase [Bacteroidaceae bacterium]
MMDKSPSIAQVADCIYRTIPLAHSIEGVKNEKSFTIDHGTQICYSGIELKREAEFMREYIKEATGLDLCVTTEKAKNGGQIVLTLLSDNAKIKETIAEEGYIIEIGESSIDVKAKTKAGLLFASQSFRKILWNVTSGDNQTTITLNPIKISDEPRFQYRGMHLDCSRHFFKLEFVKQFIDMMALHQMNYFHWHLTDDQGWRIEIKKYPRLTEFGSMRTGTIVGRNSDADDQLPYGGYYTQDMIREVVDYAAERHITIIPEIDMPGHMLAALACYPELGCTGGPYEVSHLWGVDDDILCAGNDKTFEFVTNVLSEVIELFPSQMIHIGGDEAPRAKWKACPKCQARIQAEGLDKIAEGALNSTGKPLTPEDRLQSYFMNRVMTWLEAQGRHAIGWDEILNADLLKSATIMGWRGTSGAEAAAKIGHDVILSPLTHCYFDYTQTDDEAAAPYEPLHASVMPITVEKVYSFDLPIAMTEADRKHVLGVQANLWSEYLYAPGVVEYHALPRMSALAEVQWSNTEDKSYEDFLKRMLVMRKIYDRYGWQYGKHIFRDPGTKIDRWNH